MDVPTKFDSREGLQISMGVMFPNRRHLLQLENHHGPTQGRRLRRHRTRTRSPVGTQLLIRLLETRRKRLP